MQEERNKYHVGFYAEGYSMGAQLLVTGHSTPADVCSDSKWACKLSIVPIYLMGHVYVELGCPVLPPACFCQMTLLNDTLFMSVPCQGCVGSSVPD